MVSEVGNLDQGVLALYRPPAAAPARESSDPGPTDRRDDAGKSGDGFRAFGENGFTFWDFLDIVNPLHHVPVVGHFYRAITGDEIDPGARIAGGALFGGPIGAALSVADVTLKHNSGRDFGQHAAALFGVGDSVGDNVAVARNGESSPPNERAAAEYAVQAGRDTAPMVPPVASPRPTPPQWTSFAAVRPINAEGGLPILDPAGMTAIPVAKTSPYAFADGSPAVDSFYRARATAAPAEAAPDLQALTDGGTTGAAWTPPPANNEDGPRQLNPIHSLGGIPARAATETEAPAATLGQTTKRPDTEELLSQAADGASRGWMFQAMMRAMAKYETASQLGGNAEVPREGVIR